MHQCCAEFCYFGVQMLTAEKCEKGHLMVRISRNDRARLAYPSGEPEFPVLEHRRPRGLREENHGNHAS